MRGLIPVLLVIVTGHAAPGTAQRFPRPPPSLGRARAAESVVVRELGPPAKVSTVKTAEGVTELERLLSRSRHGSASLEPYVGRRISRTALDDFKKRLRDEAVSEAKRAVLHCILEMVARALGGAEADELTRATLETLLSLVSRCPLNGERAAPADEILPEVLESVVLPKPGEAVADPSSALSADDVFGRSESFLQHKWQPHRDLQPSPCGAAPPAVCARPPAGEIRWSYGRTTIPRPRYYRFPMDHAIESARLRVRDRGFTVELPRVHAAQPVRARPIARAHASVRSATAYSNSRRHCDHAPRCFRLTVDFRDNPPSAVRVYHTKSALWLEISRDVAAPRGARP